jgi:hypothetical protein
MGDSTFGSHFRQAGAFVRTRDPKDCRRVIVELDANLVTAVSRYFESLHVHLPGSWLDNSNQELAVLLDFHRRKAQRLTDKMGCLTEELGLGWASPTSGHEQKATMGRQSVA